MAPEEKKDTFAIRDSKQISGAADEVPPRLCTVIGYGLGVSNLELNAILERSVDGGTFEEERKSRLSAKVERNHVDAERFEFGQRETGVLESGFVRGAYSEQVVALQCGGIVGNPAAAGLAHGMIIEHEGESAKLGEATVALIRNSFMLSLDAGSCSRIEFGERWVRSTIWRGGEHVGVNSWIVSRMDDVVQCNMRVFELFQLEHGLC